MLIKKPSLIKPHIGGDTDVWGNKLNENIDKQDIFNQSIVEDSVAQYQEISRLDNEKINRKELNDLVQNTVDNYVDENTKPKLNEYVENVSKPEINRYVDTKKIELNNLSDIKKEELNRHEKEKENEINLYVSDKKSELDSYTDIKKQNLDGFTEEQKNELDLYEKVKESQLDEFKEVKNVEITNHTNSEIERINATGIDTKVSKSGDTMTGPLIIESQEDHKLIIKSTSDNKENYILGRDASGNSLFYVGKGSISNNDISMYNYRNNKGIALTDLGVVFTGEPYAGNYRVYHEGYKPTKKDVGLGLVNNYPATSDIESNSDEILATTALVSNTRALMVYTGKDFIIGGDANTYYPVRIKVNSNLSFAFWNISVSRHYGATAPGNIWNPQLPTHPGGLTLSMRWTGAGGWAGQDTSLRIIQFYETYSTMVARVEVLMDSMCVWLRGGGASYKINSDVGKNLEYEVFLYGFADIDSNRYEPIQQYSEETVRNTIMYRYPVRNTGELYVGNNPVYHAGNLPDLVNAGVFRYITMLSEVPKTFNGVTQVPSSSPEYAYVGGGSQHFILQSTTDVNDPNNAYVGQIAWGYNADDPKIAIRCKNPSKNGQWEHLLRYKDVFGQTGHISGHTYMTDVFQSSYIHAFPASGERDLKALYIRTGSLNDMKNFKFSEFGTFELNNSIFTTAHTFIKNTSNGFSLYGDTNNFGFLDNNNSWLFRVDKTTNKAYIRDTEILIGCPYNIGDVFTTTTDELPSVRWVGTAWKKIDGKYLKGTSGQESANQTGGSMTKQLSVANMAPHGHIATGTTSSDGLHTHTATQDAHIHTQVPHTHGYSSVGNENSAGYHGSGAYYPFSSRTTSSAGGENTGSAQPRITVQSNGLHAHTVSISVQNTGNGEPFNIEPEFYTVHYWVRTS